MTQPRLRHYCLGPLESCCRVARDSRSFVRPNALNHGCGLQGIRVAGLQLGVGASSCAVEECFLESGPGLPPYVGRQAKRRLHYKTGKKNFPFKSLLVALSGEPEPFSPIVLEVARAFQVALIQVELLL